MLFFNVVNVFFQFGNCNSLYHCMLILTYEYYLSRKTMVWFQPALVLLPIQTSLSFLYRYSLHSTFDETNKLFITPSGRSTQVKLPYDSKRNKSEGREIKKRDHQIIFFIFKTFKVSEI